MHKRLYVATYGCQMNERDSEEVLGMLAAQGYARAERPEEADVILLNTCSVRAHAEGRALGKMAELSALKQERPELILGILGCMAKLQQGQLFKRLPQLDLVAGPAELYDLPYLLAEIQERRQQTALSTQHTQEKRQHTAHSTQHTEEAAPFERGAGGEGRGAGDLSHAPRAMSHKVLAVDRPFRPLDRRPAGDYRRPGVTAFVTVMEGCDKACAYCIVPMTRGQEISRPAGEILAEIRALVEAGYQEITLLGQNVNSYGKRFPDGSGYRGPLGRLRLLEEDPESLLDFPQLLRLIDREARVPRIRFTTSHPFDATERLFLAIRECPSVCEWLHLPVQSGSNRILRAMRRGYTAEAYRRRIERLRALVPEVSLSTDIIVGFPGETEEDFDATARLLREVRYDSAYVFKYSPRPGTAAAAREDDVPQAVKEERNQRVLMLQEAITRERHERFTGQVLEILVEGRGKFAGQWFGRTRGNHGVIVPARHGPGDGGGESPEDLLGEILPVRVVRAAGHTLFGEVAACSASLP